ncbi:ShlB/FhaC/HecB family hemolysin secretion/activation protein [Qipengyuania sp.]|uniref:ShlB/FhaC/HecB family hemolysin secretion/activation protein n=1 Tax=Qipengyuania sp. TaxID=2004515 RepID=UPI003AF5AE83
MGFGQRINTHIIRGHGAALRTARASLLAGVMAFGLPAAAQAQSVPSRSELAPPQAREPVRPDTTLTIDGGMERAPCALDAPDLADIKVTLSSVRFVGAEKAPDVALTGAYQDYLGRELPISVLCDVRAAANQRLQQAGYLATVEIPAQRLSNGDAEMRIVFGRVTALRVRGDAGPSEQLVAGYLEPLTQDEVFNTRRAERYLLLADDLPGVDVRLSLRPASGGEPGDLVGDIAVVRRRGALDFNFQNLGSKSLGRFGGLLRGEVYDLTGLGDRTSLALFSTIDFDEQQTIQLGHDFALGADGLRMFGQFTYSWTDPDLDLPGLDVKSETLFATAGLAYPILRSRSVTHVLSGGLDYVDQDLTVNDLRLTRDRVRTAFLRLESDYVDPASVAGTGGYSAFAPQLWARSSVELRQGIDIFDASPDCRTAALACIAAGVAPNRIEADPTPLLVRIEGEADYRPIPDLRFSLGMSAQFTGDPLPAFEEFAAGNYSIGRGYDPGSVLGDNGYALSFEIGYGSTAPTGPNATAWEGYLFTDMAWAWNEDPSRSPLNPDRLWSAGAGLRFAYGSALQADVAVAVPLEKPDLAADRGDVRVLFSLTTRLLPWRF